jgi:hypothetical protein
LELRLLRAEVHSVTLRLPRPNLELSSNCFKAAFSNLDKPDLTSEPPDLTSDASVAVTEGIWAVKMTKKTRSDFMEV